MATLPPQSHATAGALENKEMRLATSTKLPIYAALCWVTLIEFFLYVYENKGILYEADETVENLSLRFSILVMALMLTVGSRMSRGILLVLIPGLYLSGTLTTIAFGRSWTTDSFSYLFFHTSLICMTLNILPTQTKIDLSQWHEYFLAAFLLSSLLCIVTKCYDDDYPILRAVVELFPLVCLSTSHCVFLILKWKCPGLLSQNHYVIILNILTIICLVISLSIIYVAKHFFDLDDRRFSNLNSGHIGYDILRGNSLLSIMLSIASMCIFNMIYGWYRLIHDASWQTHGHPSIKQELSQKFNPVVDSWESINPSMVWIFVLFTVVLFLVNTSLYRYLQYYGQFALGRSRVKAKDAEIYRGFDATIERFHHGIITFDCFFLFLSGFLASCQLDKRSNWFFSLMLTVSGHLGTISFRERISSIVEPAPSYPTICYALAHVGLAHVSRGTNPASIDGMGTTWSHGSLLISVCSVILSFFTCVPSYIEGSILTGLSLLELLGTYWDVKSIRNVNSANPFDIGLLFAFPGLTISIIAVLCIEVITQVYLVRCQIGSSGDEYYRYMSLATSFIMAYVAAIVEFLLSP